MLVKVFLLVAVEVGVLEKDLNINPTDNRSYCSILTAWKLSLLFISSHYIKLLAGSPEPSSPKTRITITDPSGTIAFKENRWQGASNVLCQSGNLTLS